MVIRAAGGAGGGVHYAHVPGVAVMLSLRCQTKIGDSWIRGGPVVCLIIYPVNCKCPT